MSQIVEDIINEINEGQIHEGRKLMLYEMRPIMEKHIAKVERPKGKWAIFGKQGGIPITDICSNCHYETEWYKNKFNFCPNCGADMRSTDEK